MRLGPKVGRARRHANLQGIPLQANGLPACTPFCNGVDASMDEEPAAPPPSHVATDDELRALEREVFAYNPSVDDSGYTTDTDSDADSEMSDIPAPPIPHSPRDFPREEICDLDVDVIIDP
ncbi:hypothetical protein PGTUg99_025248 [Puccinia graminis f. sp. tritici]|uniref:Uncharacterized protein n=1 Tax=Puccinia graminis f. sp. tritici TaxID=56615 RepID=A0A5B0LNF3_PUCGR|nr:hypothetical protein PGTUg99_025248 [Puccinia graminis f. sp. tritici]